MKVVVVHGDDQERVQSRVLDIIKGVKKKGWQVRYIDKSTSLASALSLNSLFDENILFVAEHPEKFGPQDIEWLSEHCDDLPVSFLLRYKTVPAKVKKVFPKNTKYEEFKLPFLLFSFLEAIVPGNSERALKLLKQVTDTQAPELVFAMLARHLRDLYWVKNGADGMKLTDWRKGKLTAQSNKFDTKQLKGMISFMATADVQAKTSEVPLAFSLDLMLVKCL